MMRLLATVFAALAGLAFGSFLNVCLSRWPEGESIVKPRSHCRHCQHPLAWWENIPVVSWITLRGRCRSCGARIEWRYPLVELTLGGLWGLVAWRFADMSVLATLPGPSLLDELARSIGRAVFSWLLVALAVLDAEYLWLPDRLTWPGMALGFAYSIIPLPFGATFALFRWGRNVHLQAALASLMSMFLAAGLILLIRWLYKLLRHHEGIGLGDAKLMAMLAAWLGLPGALLSFFIGVTLGAVVALFVLATRFAHQRDGNWALTKLPLGTFLCIGGIVSALWGQPIIAAYLRWAGF
ncbi:MAG: prepilin peptidase [Terracidiphilus sp.]